MNKAEYFTSLPVALNEEQLFQFENYYNLLNTWSKVMNLTTILEEKEVYIKHFFDSLSLVKAYQFKDEKIIDIGSGAGFPGIPLKIAFPRLKITLVEPTKKRVLFLNTVIQDLSLTYIEALSKRAEDLSDKKETFDLVTARAVASLPILLELSIPLLKVGGYMLAMKGSQIEEELKASEKALKTLGCLVEEIITFDLPFEEGKRTIIKIKKIKKTDPKYPRAYAQIKKKTL